MVAAHFIAIPCEPDTANRHIESHIFSEICLCSSNIVYTRFEVFRTFLRVFMNVLRVSYAKSYGTVDFSLVFLSFAMI